MRKGVRAIFGSKLVRSSVTTASRCALAAGCADILAMIPVALFLGRFLGAPVG